MSCESSRPFPWQAFRNSPSEVHPKDPGVTDTVAAAASETGLMIIYF